MYRVTYQIGVLAAIALMSGCSGDQAQEQRRNEAYQYYRTTNTVIPVDNEDHLVSISAFIIRAQ